MRPPSDAPKMDAWERPDAGFDENRKSKMPRGTYMPPPPTPHADAKAAPKNHMMAPTLMDIIYLYVRMRCEYAECDNHKDRTNESMNVGQYECSHKSLLGQLTYRSIEMDNVRRGQAVHVC